jgi:hypothetical protein
MRWRGTLSYTRQAAGAETSQVSLVAGQLLQYNESTKAVLAFCAEMCYTQQ